MTKVLGEDLTSKLLGAPASNIKMPPLPKIEGKTDSVQIRSRESNKNEAKLTEKERQKYNYLYIRELFETTRNGQANDNDLAKWMNVMSQGATREGVYRALVLDNTYRGFENLENPVNDSVIEFAAYYLAKYTGQGVDKAALERANFYTLKRVVTEKTLEIIDAFPNTENLYSWYAIMSGELANDYAVIWENKMRREKSPDMHKSWAMNVPEQHLKSEVIIKLHKVFNHLMQ